MNGEAKITTILFQSRHAWFWLHQYRYCVDRCGGAVLGISSMAKPVIPEPSPRFFGWSLVVSVIIVAAVAVFRTMFSVRGVSKMISKTITPVIEHKDHVKYWTRHLGVTKDELTRPIERVGNSAAAVRNT
jgi:Protein of unknown function (DUF3606)